MKLLGFVCTKVIIAEFEELTRKAKQSVKSWSRSPSVMTKISQVKVESVRLDSKIRQVPTEAISPSETKNIVTSCGERRCIVVFTAGIAEQTEYN